MSIASAAAGYSKSAILLWLRRKSCIVVLLLSTLVGGNDARADDASFHFVFHGGKSADSCDGTILWQGARFSGSCRGDLFSTVVSGNVSGGGVVVEGKIT